MNSETVCDVTDVAQYCTATCTTQSVLHRALFEAAHDLARNTQGTSLMLCCDSGVAGNYVYGWQT